MNTATQAAPEDVIEGAIAEVKTDNALVTIDPTKYAAAAFEPYKKDFAAAKRAASKAGPIAISTPAGMKQAKELRTSFRTIRTAVENARKAAKEPVLEAGKKIDLVAKEFTAEVVPFEDKFDKLVKDEEQRLEDEKQARIAAERARIEAIENRLAAIKGLPARNASKSSAEIQTVLEELRAKQIDPALYDEFLEDAITSLNTSIDELTRMYDIAVEREAAARKAEEDARELARLKAEQAERDAAQARQLQAEADKAAAAQAELDKLRAEMESMRKANEVNRPSPVTGATPLDERVPINAQGQYYSTTTFRDDGKPILCNADGTRSIFCDVDEDYGEDAVVPNEVSAHEPLAPAIDISTAIPRPSEHEIVECIAVKFGVRGAVVLRWLAASDFSKVDL